MRFLKLAPVTFRLPPGRGLMNMLETSGGLGLTEATSNVDCVADAWPKTSRAKHTQRIKSPTVLILFSSSVDSRSDSGDARTIVWRRSGSYKRAGSFAA